MTDMGIFRATIEIAPLDRPEPRVLLHDVMVDTGSEYSWAPADLLGTLGIVPVRIERFESADGRILERPIGFAMLTAGGRSSPTIFAFAEAGDMTLLGAFGLEGLNLRVDLGRRELVPAGPLPAARASALRTPAGRVRDPGDRQRAGRRRDREAAIPRVRGDGDDGDRRACWMLRVTPRMAHVAPSINLLDRAISNRSVQQDTAGPKQFPVTALRLNL
jgi:predicted aspartyl protease